MESGIEVLLLRGLVMGVDWYVTIDCLVWPLVLNWKYGIMSTVLM